jgi:hypothetical protein
MAIVPPPNVPHTAKVLGSELLPEGTPLMISPGLLAVK